MPYFPQLTLDGTEQRVSVSLIIWPDPDGVRLRVLVHPVGGSDPLADETYDRLTHDELVDVLLMQLELLV